MNCTDKVRLGGPTPWHLPKFPNGESTDGKKIWKNVELKKGEEFRVGLINEGNEFLVLIGFYWYACALTSDLWLFWRRYKPEAVHLDEPAEVQFRLVDLESASRIEDVESALRASGDRNSAGICHNGNALVEQNYLAAFPPGITKIPVPARLSEAGNVLVLADIGSFAGYPAEVHIAILDFDLRRQIVSSSPQDWFNKGNLDFGYQWISRVWRDEKGRICGEGVRIGEFRLDSTGRHLDQSFFGLQ